MKPNIARAAVALTLVLSGAVRAQEGPADGRAPEKHALLIGVGTYPLMPESNLSGPPNDVALWRDLLVSRRFGYPDDPDRVRVLTDGSPDEAMLPTRGHIEREFRALAEKVKPGDHVFILLAGHGAYQPWDVGRPGNHEPDGADEVFLPRDANRYFKGRYENGIVDDELRAWVDALARREALIWIVMDCCHSGTGLRGERPRTPTAPGTTAPPADLEAARVQARQRFGRDGGETVSYSLLPESPNVAAIFACEPGDSTPEMLMDADGTWYGLLSRELVGILEQEPPGSRISTLHLVDKVRRRYGLAGRSRPKPLPEGKLVDRVFLSGADALGYAPPIVLTREEDGRWRINAGLARAIEVGTELDVFPPGAGPREATEPVARVRAVRARVAEAFVEPIVGEPVANASCEVDLLTTRTFQVPIAVDQPLPGEGEGSSAVTLSAEDRTAISEILRSLAAEAGTPIRFVSEPTTPGAWLVRRPAPGAESLQLAAPGGVPAFGLAPGPELLDDLRTKTRKIAKATNLLAVYELWMKQNRRLERDSDLEVAMRLVRLERDGREVEETLWDSTWPDDVARERPVLHDGDVCEVVVDNTGRSALDVNVLFLSAEQEVVSKFPAAYDDFNKLRTPDDPVRVLFRVGTEQEGIDRWLLIAAKSEPGVEQKFLFLEQESLEEARRALPPTRSPLVLEELLLKAGFPRPNQRGDAKSLDSDNCLMELIEYRSTP